MGVYPFVLGARWADYPFQFVFFALGFSDVKFLHFLESVKCWRGTTELPICNFALKYQTTVRLLINPTVQTTLDCSNGSDDSHLIEALRRRFFLQLIT